MRICMAPSSPHAMRTYHLLRIPDILLANDSRHLGSYWLSNTARSEEFRRLLKLASTSEMASYQHLTVDDGTVADCLAVFGIYRMVLPFRWDEKVDPDQC